MYIYENVVVDNLKSLKATQNQIKIVIKKSLYLTKSSHLTTHETPILHFKSL